MTKSISWSVNFDITVDGESVNFSDLEESSQQHILDLIKEDFYTGMFDEASNDDERTPADEILDYVKDGIKDYEIAECWECITNRQPIPKKIEDNINDICEEYCDDNDLPEGWWLGIFEDAEDIVTHL